GSPGGAVLINKVWADKVLGVGVISKGLPAVVMRKTCATVIALLLAVEVIRDQLNAVGQIGLEGQVEPVAMPLFFFVKGGKALRHNVMDIRINGWSAPGVVIVGCAYAAILGGIEVTVVVGREIFLGSNRTDQKTYFVILPTN